MTSDLSSISGQTDNTLSETAPQPPAAAASPSGFIMVAEDEEFLAHVYQTKLTKAGYQTLVVANGDQLLAAAKKNPPDLIVLDLIMPVKDGFETLAELKKTPALAHIPVLVMSNLGQSEDVAKAMGLGAVSYVVKSNLSLDQMLKVIQQTLAQKT